MNPFASPTMPEQHYKIRRKKHQTRVAKAPHRGPSAHKVIRQWPYYRAALLWLAAWVTLVAAIASFVYGFWLKNNTFIYLSMGIMGSWFFLRLMYYFSAKATKCPLCRACQLVNTQAIKHKNAYKIFPFSYGSTAVLTALFKRCVRCMHCGVSFDLTKKH